ncbi:MAG: hypothetical protein LJE57_00560 [Gallionella sp.]|nr:hypothetical protein [Gallionella sp.]
MGLNYWNGDRQCQQHADATNPFFSPLAIAIDSANNRALVVESVLKAVVAVDPVNGERVILSK